MFPKNNIAKLKHIIIFAFFILFIAHGAYTSLIPNLAINAITAVLIVFILWYYFIRTPKYFDLLLILYICSHFYILEKYGGLFTLCSFFLGSLILLKPQKLPTLNDAILKNLVNLFIVVNILGWLFKNRVDYGMLILGIICLFSFVFIFQISRRVILTAMLIKKMILTFIFMSFYQLVVSLNARYTIISTEITHLLPTNPYNAENFFSTGTLHHSELYGEYGLLMFLFLLPFLFSKQSQSVYKLKHSHLIAGVLCSLINIFLSGSRSVFALLIIGIFVYFIYFMIKTRFEGKRILKIIIAGSVFLALTWNVLHLDFVIERFSDQKLGAKAIDTNKGFDLLTGEGTARELAFSYFWKRYPQESWWIGYGWGIPESNRIAWFNAPDEDMDRADYHSLYLSVIMIYGYVGSLIYLSLFLITIYRLLHLIQLKKLPNYYKLPLIGFCLMLIFLLLNEYKISLMRNANYHMLTWIWLGLSNGLIVSIKRGNYKIAVI